MPMRLLAVLAVFLSTGPVFAAPETPEPPAPTHAVQLDTGETLKGVLVERTDAQVVLEHPVLGRVVLPSARVSSVVALAQQTGAPAPAPEQAPSPPPSAPPASEPPPAEPEHKWSGRVEAGLNGSEGNTQQLSFRFGASIERKSKHNVFSAGATYRLKSENGDKTQNELILKERYEWLMPPTPWSVFIESNQEFNEFRDYDFRVDALLGVGYRFIDEEKTRLVGRVGGGVAREFGGQDDEFFPMALASLEFAHRLTDRIQFTAYGEYKPDLSDFKNYQVLGRASFDIALNDSKSLFLKLGIEDRYDNDPGRARANDIDYFATIVYAF